MLNLILPFVPDFIHLWPPQVESRTEKDRPAEGHPDDGESEGE